MSTSELDVPQPRGALSRLRRNKGLANSSTNSVVSSDSNDGVGLRSSVDQGARRLSTDERRGSADDRSRSRRISAMFSRNKNKKGRSKSSRQRDSDDSPDEHSGGSADHALPTSRSEVSLVDESGNSSLLTDDYSDHEDQSIRPTLSSHNSHVGYLTLSSPLINAQPEPEALNPDLANNVPRDAQSGRPQLDIPSIVEPSSTDPATTADPSKQSPIGKLRSAFALNRKRSSDDISTKSLDRGAVGEAEGAEGGSAGVEARGAIGSQASGNTGQEWSKASTALPNTERFVSSEQQRPRTPDLGLLTRTTEASNPQTPPSRPQTPETLVTPPTPTEPTSSTFRTSGETAASPSRKPVRVSSPENGRRRRALSGGQPSKLSKSTTAPLTPTVEEAKTPGGTFVQPSNSGGFFSSVFTAAQKAADSLSNTISTSSKPGETLEADQSDNQSVESSRPAVETLGKGDLSLSHLGITESTGPSPMSSTADLHQPQGALRTDASAVKAEEEAAARAVSVAYEKPVAAVVSQANGGRPTSIASTDRLTLSGDQSPQRAGEGSLARRAGSVRSRLSGRRHRGSSAATGVGAVGLAPNASSGQVHRLTGFAVASKKRNKDFHQLFRSVPEDDYLIEDYSAALQRDILLHGRLYVSEGHICFSSNILGWITNLVMSFDEVVSVEKKTTAVIFPNALVIQTLQAKNTFASFVARDSTYELIIGIWKINHPHLKSSLNGVALDNNNGTGDKTEKAESVASGEASEDDSEDEVYDEDAEDDGNASFVDAEANRSIAGSDIGDSALSRKPSGTLIGSTTQASPTTKGAEVLVADPAGGPSAPSDGLGPETHAPTECSDTADHYDRPLTDTTIPAPLGKIYSLMFGPASSAFMRKWLTEDQKCRELDLAEDKFGLDNDHKTFVFSYIKPLNAPVGPKQTKCITTNTLETFDLEKAITINCSTQTPDVPSGSVFSTKTKYCLMWGPGNSTRIIVNCTIEWTGKSWLKGPIEKGAQDGQIQYVKDVTAALKAAVTTKATPKGALKKGKRRGRKDDADDSASAEEKVAAVVAKQEPNWGIFELFRGPLDPLFSLLRPFLTSQVMIAVLFVLLVYTRGSPPGRSNNAIGFPGYTSPHRIAAYEEIWRREESELWDWLEDRVGLDSVYAAKLGDAKKRQKVLASRKMGKKLEDEKMEGRQLDEAIKVTEERLGALKDAVDKKKIKQQASTMSEVS